MNRQPFLDSYKLLYEPAGVFYIDLQFDEECEEYGGCSCLVDNKRIYFRSGKITPTKTGQFITFWKRCPETGVTMPYESSDEIDELVVSVRAEEKWGHFIFPKSVLIEKGVLSHNGKDGKRALRVYPPWDVVESTQAKKTQKWQQPFFRFRRMNEA